MSTKKSILDTPKKMVFKALDKTKNGAKSANGYALQTTEDFVSEGIIVAEQWQTVANKALKDGLIGGLVSILIGLMSHVLGLVDLQNPNSVGGWVSSILNWGVIVGAIFMAIKHHRDNELGGYITMGRSIGMGVLTE